MLHTPYIRTKAFNCFSITLLVIQKFNLNPLQRHFKNTNKKAPNAHCYATHYLQLQNSSITNQRMALVIECLPCRFTLKLDRNTVHVFYFLSKYSPLNACVCNRCTCSIFILLLHVYRHKCFTGKYTLHNIHVWNHIWYSGGVFSISSLVKSNIDDFTDIKFDS